MKLLSLSLTSRKFELRRTYSVILIVPPLIISSQWTHASVLRGKQSDSLSVCFPLKCYHACHDLILLKYSLVVSQQRL